MKIKNFLKTIVFSLSILLAVISCKPFAGNIMVLDEENNKDYVTFTGILENYKEVILLQTNVSSSQTNARTITPDVSINDYDFYLFGQADYGNTDNVIGPYPITLITEASVSQGIFKCTLPKGIWYLTLTAFKSESNGGTKPVAGDLKYFYTNDETKNRPLLTGMVVCDVSNTNKSKPKFLLSPEGLTTKGNVNLQIELEGWNILKEDGTPKDGLENIGVKCGINKINPYAPAPVIVTETDITMTQTSGTDSGNFYATDITPGSYEFKLIFYNTANPSNRWVWSDNISIYPGRDTNTTVYIPEIKLNMNAIIEPEAPTEFLVSHYKTSDLDFISDDGLFYTIVFEWKDNSFNENGFEISLIDIDDNSNSFNFDKNIEFYRNNYVSGSLLSNRNKLEVRIPFGHRYKAQIRAVNDAGGSTWCDAELKTTNLDSNQEAFKQLGADSNADEWNSLNMYKISYFLNGGKLNEAVTLNGVALVENTSDFIQYGPSLSGDFSILDKGKITRGNNNPEKWSRNSSGTDEETVTNYSGYENINLWAIYGESGSIPVTKPSDFFISHYSTLSGDNFTKDNEYYGCLFTWTYNDSDAEFKIKLTDLDNGTETIFDKYIKADEKIYINAANSSLGKTTTAQHQLHARVQFGHTYKAQICTVKNGVESDWVNGINDPDFSSASFSQFTNTAQDTEGNDYAELFMFRVKYHLNGGTLISTGSLTPALYGEKGSVITLISKDQVEYYSRKVKDWFSDSSHNTQFTDTVYSGPTNLDLWASYELASAPESFTVSRSTASDWKNDSNTAYTCIFRWNPVNAEDDYELTLWDISNGTPVEYVTYEKDVSANTNICVSGGLSHGNSNISLRIPFGKKLIASLKSVSFSGISEAAYAISFSTPGSNEKNFPSLNIDGYSIINMFSITYQFNGGTNFEDITLADGTSYTANTLEKHTAFFDTSATVSPFNGTDSEKIFIIEDEQGKVFNMWTSEPKSTTKYENSTYSGPENLVLWAQYKNVLTNPGNNHNHQINNSDRIKVEGATNISFDNPTQVTTFEKGKTITFTLTPAYTNIIFTSWDNHSYANFKIYILNDKDRILYEQNGIEESNGGINRKKHTISFEVNKLIEKARLETEKTYSALLEALDTNNNVIETTRIYFKVN